LIQQTITCPAEQVAVKVSVIVTTYDLFRLKDALEAVYSILNQSHRNIEIIVVVDRNLSLHQKMKEYLPPPVKLVFNQTGGLSNSRNAGIKHATGDIIAFIDDDAVADKNWVYNLLQSYADPLVIGAGGKIKPMWYSDDKTFPEELFWIIGCTYKGCPEFRTSVRNTFGGNLSFRRSVFENNEFCPNIGRNGLMQLTADETDLSLRLLNAFPDHKIIFDPNAVVYHRIYPYRLSLPFIMRRAYGEGISKAYMSKRHKGNALSTENSYLKSMILKWLPRKLIRLFSLGKEYKEATQDIALTVLVTSTVIAGYMRGKIVLS
jgi:glycosyltransferase involved in cell wall biosynthesis